MKAILLTLLLTGVCPAAVAAGMEETIAGCSVRRPPPCAGEDVAVDAGDGRSGAEAVLPRSGQPLLRTADGVQGSPEVRGALYEAALFRFSPRKQTYPGGSARLSALSTVSILHFPRPPPSAPL